MRAVLLTLFVTVAALAAPAPAQPALAATEGWVQLPAEGATSTPAFVTVSNPSMYDAYLVGASSDVAAEIEFLQAGPGGETQPLKELTVPAYDKIVMAPAGAHMLMSQLKRPLKAGESITVVLTTDSGVTIQVAAIVRQAPKDPHAP